MKNAATGVPERFLAVSDVESACVHESNAVVGSVDNILQPVLIGRQSSMHDLLVFFSMLGGLAVFGVTGFIVGPVIAALFLALLDIYGIEFSKQLQALHDPHVDPRQLRATSASP